MASWRPSLELTLMEVARTWSLRSTCTRRSVGCVVASPEGHTLATGYNGSAPGAPHCCDVGCLVVDGHCVRTTHAEANAIAQAARRGVVLDGATVYVTAHPCPRCLGLLIAAGVVRVVYGEPYHAEEDAASREIAEGRLELSLMADRLDRHVETVAGAASRGDVCA